MRVCKYGDLKEKKGKKRSPFMSQFQPHKSPDLYNRMHFN